MNGKGHNYQKIDTSNYDKDNNEIDIHKGSEIHYRCIENLDTIRKRIWKDRWPLVTEAELARTGPAILNPNEYHNYTCWPWLTAIEMLARSKFDKLEQQDLSLISELISEDNRYTLYEWIDPSTESGHGAFPFRTGVSCIRMALRHIVTKNQNKYNLNINSCKAINHKF